MDLVKRAALRFRDNGLADWAAALTYYGLLSITNWRFSSGISSTPSGNASPSRLP